MFERPGSTTDISQAMEIATLFRASSDKTASDSAQPEPAPGVDHGIVSRLNFSLL